MTARVAPPGGPEWSGPAGATLSGLLLALAMRPLPLPLLVFVALVPLWVTLDRFREGRQGARIGAWFGVTFWLVHLAWMPSLALRLPAAWPAMAWLGQVALLGLLTAAMGCAFVLLRRRGVGLVLAATVAWVGVEWTRGHLLGPLSFPWSGIALPLARIPNLVQPAAWGGETLVAAGVVVVNGLVVVAIEGGRVAGGRVAEGKGGAVRPLGLAVGLVALWAGLGAGRRVLLEGSAEVQARAVLVQPAVSLAEKRGPRAVESALASLREGLERAEAGVREEGATVVVFPETHLPLVFRGDGAGVGATSPADPAPAEGRRDWPLGLQEELQGWAAAQGVSLLVGTFRSDEEGVRNSLIHLDGDGVVDSYDKVALVPGVEWGPGGLVAGTASTPLEAPGRPGPLICIESAWGSLAMRQVWAGAGWLLNVTNDAWLGDGHRIGESAAFHQHPLHLVFRSVETGRGALRVANNGWTGSVDPFGVWEPALPPHAAGVAVAEVRSLGSDPLFVWTGDFLGPLAALLLALGALLPHRSPTR